MNQPTILVTGAPGNVGSALVSALLDRGANVRAMIRNPQRPVPGVENVVADLRDPDAVAHALTGADIAFLNSPSEEEAPDLQIRFLNIAQDSGVGRVVLLSQFAASADSPVRFLRWHARVEAHLAQLGLDYTVLRPNLYLQALAAFGDLIAQGMLPAPIGNAPVSAIDTRDIADSAAHVLTTDGHEGRTYTLTGPRAVTHSEIADALSNALGWQVSFQDVPPEDFAAALAGHLPEWQVQGLIEDYAHYARGEAAEVSTAVADLTGHPGRDVEQFATDHTSRFTPK